ncbi:MAG: hypothetical protein AAF648_12430, partial [Pseudomonadota bacterium]
MTDPTAQARLDLEDAIRRIETALVPVSETVVLRPEDALGRVLAEPIAAPLTPAAARAGPRRRRSSRLRHQRSRSG